MDFSTTEEMLAFDFKTANETLIEATNKEADTNRVMYIIVGPNGSGKSTLIANLYVFEPKILEHVPYINADIFAQTIFADEKDEDQKNIKAMNFATEKVNSFIESGKSFVYESVFSHPSKLELVHKAIANGYKIVSVLVYTKDPKINVARVQKRARQGGHDVPEDKIISRFPRSLQNAYKLELLSDAYNTLDNTTELLTATRVTVNFDLNSTNLGEEEQK